MNLSIITKKFEADSEIEFQSHLDERVTPDSFGVKIS